MLCSSILSYHSGTLNVSGHFVIFSSRPQCPLSPSIPVAPANLWPLTPAGVSAKTEAYVDCDLIFSSSFFHPEVNSSSPCNLFFYHCLYLPCVFLHLYLSLAFSLSISVLPRPPLTFSHLSLKVSLPCVFSWHCCGMTESRKTTKNINNNNNNKA